MKLFLSICTIFLLTACAVLPTDDRAALVEFTLADLKAAHESAVAHNDPIAANCWMELSRHVETRAAVPPTEKVGAATRWQMLRNLRRTVERGVPESVNVACAPLVTSAGATVLRLRALVGG